MPSTLGQTQMLPSIWKMAGRPSSSKAPPNQRESHLRSLEKKLAQAYKKYKEYGYTPKPNSWDEGGLYVFTPRQCIAWSKFNEDPTKFIFEG